MSGAEFIAVIGIGASMVQLSEACHNFLVRIRQYRDHSAFLELDTQIRLFSKHVEALQDPRAQTGLDSDLTAEFIDLLGACRRKIQELETLIESQMPKADSNSFKRVSQAIRSLLKDRRLKGILDDLASYQRIMTLHLARATWNNQRDVLQLLAAIERTTSTRFNTAPSLNQPAYDKLVPGQGTVNFLGHSLAARRPSRQSLCALGTCGCPCHINKARLGILGFAGPSPHLFHCCCTQSHISFDVSGLQRLLQFNMAFSWHESLNISFSLKYKRFVAYTSPGLSLLNSYRFTHDTNEDSRDHVGTKTFSDFMRLCRSGHADLDDEALIESDAFHGWKLYGGYLEAALAIVCQRTDRKAQIQALELATLLVKQGVAWKTSRRISLFVSGFICDHKLTHLFRPIDVLNVVMAHSETTDSRSKLRTFLRQAPSLDIEVGQLSGASESLAPHWPKWKSESDQDLWDPFYLKIVEGLLDCESVVGCLPPLHLAVIKGDFDEAVQLIDNLDQKSLQATDVWGHCAVHLAVHNSAILEHLATKISRADLEREDFFGNTPLMYAAGYGQASSIDLLLRHGADPFRANLPARQAHISLKEKSSTGPIFDSWTFAVLSGSIETFNQLLDWYTLRASYGEVRGVINRSLEDYLAKDLRFRSCVPRQADLDMLRFLVKIGAELDQADDRSDTLLHKIVIPEEALILLDGTGYSINHQNNFHCTPLIVLALTRVTNASSMLQAIRTICAKGALIGSTDSRGKTAIHQILGQLRWSLYLTPTKDVVWPNLTFSNPVVAKSSILEVALMVKLGADFPKGDSCTCPCCADGCSLFRHFFYRQTPAEDFQAYSGGNKLRDCLRHAEEIRALPWLIELFLLLQQLGQVADGHEMARMIFRIWAFELLEMTHTCCCDNFTGMKLIQNRAGCIGDSCIGFVSRRYQSSRSSSEVDDAAFKADMREIEEEEHEIATELERKCEEFAQSIAKDPEDVWLELLAQRLLKGEDIAKSAFQKVSHVPWDLGKRIEELKKQKDVVVVSVCSIASDFSNKPEDKS
ncbi:hypothetical protein IWZ01DRAFT_199787 [Phyllosticta capitalensis]